MESKLQIIHLEDNTLDAALVESILKKEETPCEITRVATRESFVAAMKRENVDLILSDFSMPQFDGYSALAIARVLRPHVPFVFLSGTIGEAVAVESLKQGATDFILKDQLSRLSSSVRRAVREARELNHRRRVEEQLRKSEERFQLAARATQDVVWDWDLVLDEVWWSENFWTQFGYGREQLERGAAARHNRIHPNDRERVVAGVHAFIDSRAETWLDEYRFRSADGVYRYVLDRAYAVRKEESRPVRMIGAMTDITKRKEAEERISEQAALLDKARDAICVVDMSQEILYWNRSAERLYGWTAEEAIGHQATVLLFRENPDGQREAIRSLIRTGEWLGELGQVTRDGRKLVVESRWTLLRDESGGPKSILVINTDVTERKNLEAQILRTQRLESIGALSGGIAHDLNNALSPILMGVGLLRDGMVSDEGLPLLELMSQGARHGADMVRQILSFARGVGGAPETLQLKPLIEEMSSLAGETFPRSIKVETTVAEDLRPVLGNATQLHQVLLNLCVNARDAMPQGGSLKISADNAQLAREQLPPGKGLLPGPYVLLEVADTGVGIPPEIMHQIFEPFFTTKGPEAGTGLGLSTVMGIVKTHGGFVEVTSEVNRGTTFKVYVPATVSPVAALSSELKASSSGGAGEQILVVDDEAAVLELIRLSLTIFNYRVMTARNGAEALRIYQLNAAAIQAVITDMMMPTMDGPELVKHLRSINPEVKIIGVSGLGADFITRQTSELKTDAFLTKPFTSEQLLKELRRVLDLKRSP